MKITKGYIKFGKFYISIEPQSLTEIPRFFNDYAKESFATDMRMHLYGIKQLSVNKIIDDSVPPAVLSYVYKELLNHGIEPNGKFTLILKNPHGTFLEARYGKYGLEFYKVSAKGSKKKKEDISPSKFLGCLLSYLTEQIDDKRSNWNKFQD